MATRKVGPRGRDYREVDRPAILLPDVAINHVGADGQTDTAPRCGYHQRCSTRSETEPFPEDQVTFTINLDCAIGQADGQRIVKVFANSLDDPGRDPHSPLSAAIR